MIWLLLLACGSPPASVPSPQGGQVSETVSDPRAYVRQAFVEHPANWAHTAAYNLDDPAKRPPWWDRLPPEVQQKLLAMSPDERRAYLQELRERRRAAREAGQ